MKYIVLAAGSGVGSITAINNLPKCLIKINGKTVIQNVEEVCFENNITDINIVGGFEILKIMQEYPEHKYFYNEKWEKTNSLYSLHKVINIVNDDIIVSYSDVIHDADTISNLIQHAENINIIYDSLWRNRYENRDIDNIEKVFNSNMDLVGEFAGLCFIPKKSLPDIRVKTSELLHKNLKFSILDLIAEMLKSNDILLTDVKGNWAELDSIQDVNHFKFGTKAETLESLRNRLVLSSVLEQYTFSVSDYIKDKNNVFLSIQSNLKSKLLVVRSSALDEDTHDTSNAGNYKSVLKVLKDDISALEKSIEMVVDSYNKGGRSQNNNHQVLVQP